MALDRDSIFLWTFSKRGGTTSLKNKTFEIFEELQRYSVMNYDFRHIHDLRRE